MTKRNSKRGMYIAHFFRENGGSITIGANADRGQILASIQRFLDSGMVPNWLAGGKIAIDYLENNKLVERVFR